MGGHVELTMNDYNSAEIMVASIEAGGFAGLGMIGKIHGLPRGEFSFKLNISNFLSELDRSASEVLRSCVQQDNDGHTTFDWSVLNQVLGFE